MNQPDPTPQEIRRADDDELLGLVTARPDGTFASTTVFGGLLGSHPDEESARRQVENIGLSSLAEPWWIHLDGTWERAWLIEASPERLVAVVAPYAFMGTPQVIPPGTRLQLAEPA